MNCCVTPLGVLGLAGVTAIETSVAAVTLRVALPLSPWHTVGIAQVAVILEVPTLIAVASPETLRVATAGVAVAQVTSAVISDVELSVKVATALNTCETPAGMEGKEGVT